MAALVLCEAAGMVSLGRVALDGTKLRANASKRKAMSYARMTEKERILAAEVSALLAEAERIDNAEDKQFGTAPDAISTHTRRRGTQPRCYRPALLGALTYADVAVHLGGRFSMKA